MIKIALFVRNRLGVTKKCIEALKKFTQIPYKLYVYDNLTDYRIQDHFTYFMKLYEDGDITQITFNTRGSTFNAFSKVVATNQFAKLHMEDPDKDKCEYLLMLDNDIIVMPGWDQKFKIAWENVKLEGRHREIKVITQNPGGVMKRVPHKNVGDIKCEIGQQGGSGFWSVLPNFYGDVGLIPIRQMVGRNKGHDIFYWRLLAQASKGKPYILALNEKMAYHVGHFAGSICNKLHSGQRTVKYPEKDKMIEDMNFDKFIETIVAYPNYLRW